METQLVLPLISFGAPEMLIVLAVIVLLFGASKLPELARGSGRALRIFKAETKGLMDDDDGSNKTPEQRQIDTQNSRTSNGAVNNGMGQTRSNPEDTRPPGTV